METNERPLVEKTAGVRIPVAPGTYALLLHLQEPATLRVGRLGVFTLPEQDYIYVGSALGAGGLRARISRHLRRDKRSHWHIDSLARYAEINSVWYTISCAHLECQWIKALALHDKAWIPAFGFGASDCASGCPAHLIAFPEPVNLDALTTSFLAISAGNSVFVQR